MSKNIHTIDSEMVDSFKEMLLGNDTDSISLAMEILDNRDKTNKESENEYNKLMSMIIKDNDLFPTANLYAIRINGRFLSVNKRAAFFSRTDAQKHLSLHLSKQIGSEKKEPYWMRKNARFRPYLVAMRKIFGSGIKMRDFLLKNNLVEIVEINGR